MSNANGPSELDRDETRRALTEGELDAVAGATILMVNGGGNIPKFRGSVGSNETITIGGARTE
jgi:hypothetical protein